jgi:hypothetical protein
MCSRRSFVSVAELVAGAVELEVVTAGGGGVGGCGGSRRLSVWYPYPHSRETTKGISCGTE